MSWALCSLWAASSQLAMNIHSATALSQHMVLCHAGVECGHWLCRFLSSSLFSYTCNVYRLRVCFYKPSCKCDVHEVLMTLLMVDGDDDVIWCWSYLIHCKLLNIIMWHFRRSAYKILKNFSHLRRCILVSVGCMNTSRKLCNVSYVTYTTLKSSLSSYIIHMQNSCKEFQLYSLKWLFGN